MAQIHSKCLRSLTLSEHGGGKALAVGRMIRPMVILAGANFLLRLCHHLSYKILYQYLNGAQQIHAIAIILLRLNGISAPRTLLQRSVCMDDSSNH
jgi:hypothetical protein